MKKQIKIAYFPSNTAKATVLTYNGKTLDNYCVSCSTEEDFSSYTLDARFIIKDDITDLLVEEAILKVQEDYGKEIFRISKVTVGTRYIDIVARQITISDTMTLFLDDVRPTEQNGLSALSYIITNSTGKGKADITCTSDITRTSTAYYVRKTVYEAIQGTEDNSFLTRWGGEIQRRAYNITINDKIGSERGFTIREGKNLTGFEGSSNIDNLITRARGQGYNGILGNWIESPLINSYTKIYSNVIKYDDVKVKDENSDEGYDTLEEAQAELDRRIGLEFSDSNIDKIQATYNVNFVQLQNTKEYENYKVAETCYLGDTIRVYIPRLNQDIYVRAISKKYNVMLQRTEEITLSNTITVKPLSSQQIISDLKEQYANQGNNIASYIDSLIKAGISDSYVIYRQNEILVMDNKDITAAVNVVRLNRNGLAFSSDGYYGSYQYGFTIDGVINASLIRTGILSVIKIQNIDGSFVMDLGSTDGLQFYIDNEKSMTIRKNQIEFYDNNGTRYIGGLFSLQRTDHPEQKSLALAHKNESFLKLEYYNPDDGLYHPYIQFDKYNIDSTYGYPISVLETTDFFADVCHYNPLEMRKAINFTKNDKNTVIGTVYGSTTSNNLVIGCGETNSVCLDYLKDDVYHSALLIHRNDTVVGGCNVDMWGVVTVKNNIGVKGQSTFYNGDKVCGKVLGSTNNNMLIACNYDNEMRFSYEKDGSYVASFSMHRNDSISEGSNVDFSGAVTCYGSFDARGTKNRLVTTEHYGDRRLSAYETTECYFGDIGKSNTGEECKIRIQLDPIFLETVNTKEDYHVFLSKYGCGDIWVSELHEDYFIVESENPNLEFSFEIKAKQKDYEDVRLTEVINTKENIIDIESEVIKIDKSTNIER
jgi:phage minor structural protein